MKQKTEYVVSNEGEFVSITGRNSILYDDSEEYRKVTKDDLLEQELAFVDALAEYRKASEAFEKSALAECNLKQHIEYVQKYRSNCYKCAVALGIVDYNLNKSIS